MNNVNILVNVTTKCTSKLFTAAVSKFARVKLSKIRRLLVLVGLLSLLSSCSSLPQMPNEQAIDNTVKVNDSFLSSDEQLTQTEEETVITDNLEEGEFIRLNKLTDNEKRLKLEVDISKQFASQPQFQVSVN
jgi:hypothetical protein